MQEEEGEGEGRPISIAFSMCYLLNVRSLYLSDREIGQCFLLSLAVISLLLLHGWLKFMAG